MLRPHLASDSGPLIPWRLLAASIRPQGWSSRKSFLSKSFCEQNIFRNPGEWPASPPGRHRSRRPDRALQARAYPIWAWFVGVALSVLLSGPAQAQTPAPPPANAASLTVVQVVLGIISYTSWPAQLPSLQLCIVGHPADAQELILDRLQIGTTRLRAQYDTIADPQLGADCDVIYAGALTGSQRDQLRADISGHPILTITDNDPSCSDIIMFCLIPGGIRLGFSVNLDSIARSGVQVNPQVLLLGRPRNLPQ